MRATPCLVLALLAGCPDRTVSSISPVQGRVELKDVAANPRRDVDILFLIDNSRSMKEEQDSLKANFHRFISVLESIDGGLPNVHIGVATSDLGTQTSDGNDAGAGFGCSKQGENGALRSLPNGPRFIIDEADGAGGRRRNYTGTLDDTFAQIAAVGIDGCGIEQHLGAMERVLDPENAVNAGFLRDHAYLAVVIIADEDDCSLAHAGLFAGTVNGDEVNFRCTYDGVACDSPATDFLVAKGERQDCHPKTPSKFVESTTRYVDFLKGLKADPRDVIVAGILGPTDHFEITQKSPTDPTTVLKPSCSYPGPTEAQLAFPAVRTAAFLAQFLGRSTQSTICANDLSAALLEVSGLIIDVIGNTCFHADLADLDPYTPGPQYSCSVIEVRQRPNQPDEELAVIPACDRDDSGPCWSIVEDLERCSFTAANPHLALSIAWHGATRGDDIHIKANCITTEPDAPGPVI